MTKKRILMQPAGNSQAFGAAKRRTITPRLRGPTRTSAQVFRALKLGLIEDIRLRQLPYVAILSLALVALLELVQAGVLLAIDQPFGFPELIRDLILKVPATGASSSLLTML